MEDETPEGKWSRRRLLQGAAAAVALTALPPLAANAQAAPAVLDKGGPKAAAEDGDLLATLKPGHPRLMAGTQSWVLIQKRRGEDELLDAYLKRSEAEAQALLRVPPIEYKKDGRRLLRVSRTVLRRVLLLSLHFRLSGDNRLAERAQAEMLNAASFADWNPSHFLDVGEMTAALALGYDWLHDELSDEAREGIRAAIAGKGLKAGLANSGFRNTQNNWNSVCLGGLALGALAIAEHEPELARQVLAMTKDFNANGLKPYAPHGVYPEGAMYWGYGTTFQVMLLDTLGTALGTDWGLGDSPGFKQSAAALLQQQGPTGAFFNFSDGVERVGLDPAMWWFARELGQPHLLRHNKQQLQNLAASTRPPRPESEADRTLPLVALWWDTNPRAAATTPGSEDALPLNWHGRGAQPLASFRSSWDNPRAMFLALKAGRAMISHGHMDAGSFVFEAGGVRWARDLGMQDYLSLESKGVNMWDSAQDGDRWTVFRLNNRSHSTLTINNLLHRAKGQAEITHFLDAVDAGATAGAIVDLSPVFEGQAIKVRRGFAFRAPSHALIRDEVEGLKEGDTVRWAMPTKATAVVSPDGTQAILSEGGQKLRAVLLSSPASRFEVAPAAPPDNGYDEPNPGVFLLTASATASTAGRVGFSVILQPIANEGDPGAEDKLARTNLSQWPIPVAT